jgi:hypothetical protein
MERRRITDFELQCIPACIYRKPKENSRDDPPTSPLIFTSYSLPEENLAFIYGMYTSDKEIEYDEDTDSNRDSSDSSGEEESFVDRVSELIRKVKITNPKMCSVHEYSKNCIQKDFKENVRFSSKANQNAVNSIKIKRTAAKDCAEMFEGIKQVESEIIQRFKKLAPTANPKRIRGLSFRARGIWEKKVGTTRFNDNEGDITMEKAILGIREKEKEESLLSKIKNRSGSHAKQPSKSKGYPVEKKERPKEKLNEEPLPKTIDAPEKRTETAQ